MKFRRATVAFFGICLLMTAGMTLAESTAEPTAEFLAAVVTANELLSCANPIEHESVDEPVVWQKPVEPRVDIDGPCHCPVGDGETIQSECPSPVQGSCGDYTCDVCTRENECATRNCFSL